MPGIQQEMGLTDSKAPNCGTTRYLDTPAAKARNDFDGSMMSVSKQAPTDFDGSMMSISKQASTDPSAV